MLKRHPIVSVVVAIFSVNLLIANALQKDSNSDEPGEKILSEHDQEGLIWRLTIHEPEEKTFRFLEIEEKNDEELDEMARESKARIEKRQSGGPGYRAHNSLAINDLFDDIHIAVPRADDHFDSEARMPDSFLSKANSRLSQEPSFIDQVSEIRRAPEPVFHRVTPSISDGLGHYTHNISPRRSYTRSLQQAPPAPDFTRVRAEPVFIRYPETPGLKSRLTEGSIAKTRIQSKDAHGITSSFYALQNPKTPGETVSLAAATRSENGGFTMSAGNVVLDSNIAWSAMRARPSSGQKNYTETWDSNDADWDSRDGEMTVGHDSFGNPGGALKGIFDAQFFPFPQTDAFTAQEVAIDGDTGDDPFTGDYGAIGYWNGWTFDFYAEDVLPSDLVFRFTDGVNTFFKSFASQVTTIGVWHTVRIYPGYNSGWIGGSAFDFEQALTDVEQVDIQITRSGLEEQSFYLDNLNYSGNQVPEPNTAMFLVFGCAILTLRKKLHQVQKSTNSG